MITAAIIDSLFLLCPLTELPLLDNSGRMDMLDYYAAQMEAKGTNTMGGTSVMEEKTDSSLTVRLTDVSTWRMEIVRSPKGKEPTIQTTHTLHVPDIPDRIDRRRYTLQWKRL